MGRKIGAGVAGILIVAVLFLASCAFNVAAIAHPLWFLIAAGVAIPATLMAAFAVSKRLKGNNS